MKNIWQRWMVIVCLAALCAAWADEPKLVIVAGAKSPLENISPNEVRRLYLGLPLTRDGHELVPLRNAADPAIQEVFLQRVLFMSAQAYERQMAGRVYRGGGNRIRLSTDLHQIVDALAEDPWTLTYMSEETAARLAGVKIISSP